MKLTGAQAIIKSLEIEGIEVVFGYPGATICPFYDALLDSNIKHILTRNEQGASHAASGYSRTTKKLGVCVSTSGPGATNLITGIATAYMDSIPMLAITGQVSSELIGRDVFQEVDITGATAPFCKHNYLIKNVEEIPRVIKEAFHIATTGRKGPVLIDIPVDIQMQELEFKYPDEVSIRGYKPNIKGHSMQIKKVAEMIYNAKAPLVCAGGGIISSGASKELIELVEQNNIPVVTTLMAKSAIPCEHEQNYGMIGSHGVPEANYALNNTDLLIIIGARVGDRAIGSATAIAKKAQIIHIDIDPAEIGKNIGTLIPIVGDAKNILKQLNIVVKKGDFSEWNERLQEFRKKKKRSFEDIKDTGTVNPKYLLSILGDMVDDFILTTEVGQNQIWAANYLKIKKPGTFITSGGLGTMGYGLPAALGVKIGNPNKNVIVISGDGSFQMSMQELGTIKHNNLGIKVILFNNCRLGMVRELQKMKYNSRYSGVYMDENISFVDIFKAYGFNALKINENSEIEGAIKKMFEDDSAYLLECMVDPEESSL